ncbi:hypothetical protein LRS03_26050 [Rhizobacter sp. J219]|uniref:hypothetical protein n=1 Tax=Rhizobacter sp. J219 TaxID=2898430 RepID=UPI0021515DB2|nr:hypothetical protein [Rhizobacter sp. J219]MCR5886129.1 hypothetical protein [Rhizobacter sp. J219]
MSQPLTIETLLGLFGSLAVLQFLATLWITERFKAQLQKENGRFLESIKWDLRVREQAARVAEYMSLARSLGSESTPAESYRKANQLAWELTLWLPTDVYRQLQKAILTQKNPVEDMQVLIAVRKNLLGNDAGDLAAGEVLMHGPEVGKHRQLFTK